MIILKSCTGVVARAALATTLLVFVPISSWSHGGEDHGGAPEPMASISQAPRAYAQSEDFELVAVLTGSTLTVTLDRYATNAPVPDAQIEVESGNSLKALAKQVAPGTYTFQSNLFANPGKYPMAFSVQAGDSADLLATTLDIAPPLATKAPAPASTKWLAGAGTGAMILFGAVWFVLRRRKAARTHSV